MKSNLNPHEVLIGVGEVYRIDKFSCDIKFSMYNIPYKKSNRYQWIIGFNYTKILSNRDLNNTEIVQGA